MTEGRTFSDMRRRAVMQRRMNGEFRSVVPPEAQTNDHDTRIDENTAMRQAAVRHGLAEAAALTRALLDEPYVPPTVEDIHIPGESSEVQHADGHRVFKRVEEKKPNPEKGYL